MPASTPTPKTPSSSAAGWITPSALEGSLKFKEISYIHSEAFAAGEMKHGPISLVEKGTLVVGILTQPDLFEKSISNMVEVKSRGAFLMGLTTYGNYSIEDTAGFTVYVPKTDPHFATSLSVIPLQLLAYYVSCGQGPGCRQTAQPGKICHG